MKIAGIVAEYNPFHNGHLYQLMQTKKETDSRYVIVIMSSSFSQRGSAAICDKFTRAKMALLNGADLVLELPAVFATASAEHFAHYSVSALTKTQIVDTLSFGSESGELKVLDQLAEQLAFPSPHFENSLRAYLKEGKSFPKARELALLDAMSSSKMDCHAYTSALQNPNNILGIEYLKALKRLKSPIKPFTVLRIGTGYHDEQLTTHIASATAIRKQLIKGHNDYKHCIPTNLHPFFQEITPPNMQRLMPFIHFKLMFSNIEDLYALWDVPKPLIHSLCKHVDPTITYEELLNAVTSKTYTRATVARSLLRILLDVREETILPILSKGSVPYLRVLGCRKDATPLLKMLMQKSTLPVITNFARQYASLDASSRILLDYEITATKLYHYTTMHKHLLTQDFSTPFLLV